MADLLLDHGPIQIVGSETVPGFVYGIVIVQFVLFFSFGLNHKQVIKGTCWLLLKNHENRETQRWPRNDEAVRHRRSMSI